MSKDKALIGTVITSPEGRLGDIVEDIKAEWGKGIESQFVIGHMLIEARSLMPSDPEFGKWLAVQSFPFSRQTAHRLRQAAEREPEVRAFIASRSEQSGKDISPTWAIQSLNVRAANEDKVDPSSVKRVQQLFKDAEAEAQAEACTPAFATFKGAWAGLDLAQLPTEELVEFAGIVKEQVAAYNAEKLRRA